MREILFKAKRIDNDEWLGELNDLVFPTREEAEKKLEEMKKK